ncbi:MAG: hypothetical protein AAGJ50_08820 [Pseudomonadota bacterium]
MGVLVVFVALWPVGLGRDYFNHLPRTYILGFLDREPELQAFYAVSFDFIPDLTMDLIVPWLSQIIGIYPAGAVTVWLGFVLLPLAGLALAKTLHGHVTWLSLLGFLTVFNSCMHWGFVNYAASSGLALFAFVAWIRMAPGLRRSVVFAALSLFLVANHALAFLLFGFLALAWELVNFAQGARGGLRRFARQAVLLDFPAMLPGLLYLAAAFVGAEDIPSPASQPYVPILKIAAFFSGALFGNGFLAFIITMSFAGFFWIALREKWLIFAPKMGWVFTAFLALFVIMPISIFNIWGLHFRYSAPLLVVLSGSIAPTGRMPSNFARSCGIGFVLLGLMAFINGGEKLAAVDRQADSFRAQLSHLPAGKKVFVAFSGPQITTDFNLHAAGLAVIERNAFVPNLFTNTSWVNVTEDMIDLHLPQGHPIIADELLGLIEQPVKASRNGFWSTGYAADWPNRWDYLLYFKRTSQPGLNDLPVCEVSATPTTIIYKTGACD